MSVFLLLADRMPKPPATPATVLRKARRSIFFMAAPTVQEMLYTHRSSKPGMEVKHERHDAQNPAGCFGDRGRRVEFLLFDQRHSSTGNTGLLLGRGERDCRAERLLE